MKTIVLVGLMSVTLLVENVSAQSATRGQGNYVVVIGAFAVPENASRFIEQAKRQRLQAQVELNSPKNLYYVYLFQTDDHDRAITEVKKLQEGGPFKDSWVFTRNPVVEQPVVIEEKPKEEVVVEEVVPIVVEPKRMSAADSARMRDDKIKSEVEKKTLSAKKGEMEKLDYIFFYKDASVLRPESRFAVDKLVKLMKENPKAKIRIHGHTNGDDPGKIIRRANEKADFFSLDNTVEDYGTSKELSEQRADIIRDYLVANGIDKKRMSTKAWGGAKPLFKVDDEKAEANVRVEIEIVQNPD